VRPLCRRYTHPSKAGLHAAAYSAQAQQLSTASHQHDAATAIVRSALRTIVAACTASSSARLKCLHSLSQLDRLPHGSRAEYKRGHGVVPRGRGDVHPDLTVSVFTFTLHHPSADNVGHLSVAQRRAQHTAVCPMCAFASQHFLNGGDAHVDRSCSTCKSSSDVASCSYSCSRSLAAASAEYSTPRTRGSGHPHSPSSQTHSPYSPAQLHATSGGFQQLQPASTGLSKGSALLQLSRRLWESIPYPLTQGQQQSQPGSKRTHSLLCSARTSQSMGRSTVIPCSAGYTMNVARTPQRCASGGAFSDSGMDLRSRSRSSCSTGPQSDRRQEARRRWRVLRTHVWVSALEQGLRRSMWESACAVAINSLAPVACSSRGSFCSFPSSPSSSTTPDETGSIRVGDAGESGVVASSFAGTGISALAVLTAH
jgi:hypothetical protein